VNRRAVALATVIVLATTGLAAGRASGAADSAGRVVAVSSRPGGGLDIRYRSQGIDGDLVAETAVVWLPRGGRSGHVVAWGHPTTGLADGCAPSREADPWVPGLAQLLAAGHVVVAPDYEGLGMPGDHPYLVGASEGRSVLDAIRAARSIGHADGRSAVFGWSQGGHAALFAARLAPTYAPDVRLAGVAAIAPVTDMASLVDGRSPFAREPGFVSMVTAGYASTYEELDATDVVPAARKAMGVARRNCALEAGASLDDLVTLTPGADWERRLRQNDPTTKRLRAPVLIVQGDQDELLPAGDAVAAYRRLCSLDTTVRLQRLATAGHGSVAARSAGDVVRWLGHRLAGDPLTGCAQRRER
jgi:pimeloyl-ACP methyl ester carboxylesterase